MAPNINSDERIPRIGLAAVAGIAAVFAPAWLKTGLLGVAAGLLASVATGYCPLKAALNQGRELDSGVVDPGWRTLRTNRVQA